ncbi:hypothetical protein H0H81_012574 [Sphagnurus paluster]|uniref:FAD-binding domain-containing protein n=1 Tax=Sphagnurus paluster TaxID=117069 RepID=A0A9P7K3E0_9AGAR|nr:hypothetical protein H0H81_012574 [Sphagnurus paluster]
MTLSIAIIGTGPVGLTLARILLTSPSNVKVTISEQDASASSQTTKGGTLGLHADTGLAALDAAGLRGMVIADCKGNHVFEMPICKDEANQHPEIGCRDLRTLLLDGILEGTIQWGAHITSITSNGMLCLEGGRIDVSDYNFVVGADGTWSKVRVHMNRGKPIYSGLGRFEMHVAAPDVNHLELAREVRHGMYFAAGGGRAIMLYAMIRTQGPEDLAVIVDSQRGNWARMKDHLKVMYEAEGWGDQLLGWFDAAEPGMMRVWPLYEYELPDGHMWEHIKGWTLVGNAAHVMTLMVGEGVNAGMRDALELSKRICALQTVDNLKLDAVVKEYEEEMFVRLQPYMLETL